MSLPKHVPHTPTKREIAPLTDALIASTPLPVDGYTSLTAGNRLFLRVQPNGSRIWRLKLAVNGNETQMSLGHYPEVSIEKARALAETQRAIAKSGRSPAAIKRAEQDARADAASLTFGRVGAEYLAAMRPALAKATARKHDGHFAHLAVLHTLPIASLKRSQLITALKSIPGIPTAYRCGQMVSNIFEYGMTHYEDILTNNPAMKRKGWLPPMPQEKHRAAITDAQAVGALMRSIKDPWLSVKVITPTVRNALLFTFHTFARQHEICGALWSEMVGLDTDAPEWRVPAERMKGPLAKRRPHTVPLSRQCVAILAEQRIAAGDSRFVFPHARRRTAHMSNNTMNNALSNLGVSNDEMTPHGFRSVAKSLLTDLGADPDVIERQMSHQVGSTVSRAYDRTVRMPERRALCQRYSDHLELLGSTT